MTSVQTRSEELAQVIASSISGVLSVAGSSLVLFRLVALKRTSATESNRRPVFRRLMIGLCSFDVWVTLWIIFGFLAVPKETGNLGAMGNLSSCEAVGFMTHLVWIPINYNVSLMIYYVLTIRYEWTEARIRRWLEPCLHFFSILIPIAQASVALGLDLFNPAGRPAYGWCRMSAYPIGCEDEVAPDGGNTCERGENSNVFRLLFIKIPAVLFYVILHWAVFMIYWTLRQRTRKSRTQARVPQPEQDLQVQAQEELQEPPAPTRKRFQHQHTDTSNTNRAVVIQSLIYCAIFFWTYLLAVISLVYEQVYDGLENPSKGQERTLFILRIVGLNTLLPLQGFFICLNYLRPRYLEVKRMAKFMSKSQCWILRETAFGSTPLDQMRMKSRHFVNAQKLQQEKDRLWYSSGSADGNTVPIRQLSSGLQHSASGFSNAISNKVERLAAEEEDFCSADDDLRQAQIESA